MGEEQKQENNNDIDLKVWERTTWDDLSKLLSTATGTYSFFWNYYLMEVALAEFRKWGKSKWNLKPQIPNSTFSDPGEKISDLYKIMHLFWLLRYSESMKLELKLERILDPYF